MGDTTLLSTRSALASSPSHSSSFPFASSTPSQLTPNTRSEAEAALAANALQQTDSAAPTTSLLNTDAEAVAGAGVGSSGWPGSVVPGGAGEKAGTGKNGDEDQAKAAYRRPLYQTRTSSSNYAAALMEAARRSGVVVGPGSDNTNTTPANATNGAGALSISTASDTTTPSNITNAIGALSMSPSSISTSSPLATTTSPLATENENFPPPIAPPNTSIGMGQWEVVNKVRPTGLSLGSLGRQPSWNEQDMKHVYSQPWIGNIRESEGDTAGYSSAVEGSEDS
ncbi:hypothetical protein K432DRAFT_430190 [Lepidopterella palustris CBS 459.81]|uniref:Uncharacterized protein n=1 Tax=Lepidopterella palustris CBS 459.81 TaxID=1314670 RepID=A0A8E2J9D8_9PEZI|nr:hypothetical protein K432DRAFT_430190 [Lepidopterella palustris CBS 459.81]